MYSQTCPCGYLYYAITCIKRSPFSCPVIENYVSPHFDGDTYCFCPVRLSITQFVSTTPLKLQNRISWNLVGSKDTICSCAYYQEILIAWILWELCPFELRNFPKFTTEAVCQHNSSETTEQNFMKLSR
jgi:hypothetical protein